MKVLPIASGKGGVGKSLIASNLSIALSESGKKVILVDLDLGGSNLHLFLGIRSAKSGIGTFINNSEQKFEDIIIQTDYDGLKFIPGVSEIPGIANIKSTQKQRLIKKLLSLDADYLVLDLGAGTSYNIMDFFLISSIGIVVTAPTFVAILNAYLFIKNAIFRILFSVFPRNSKVFEYLELLKQDGNALQKIYIPQLLEKIKEIDLMGYKKLSSKLKNFNPCFILNKLADPKDADKGTQLRRSVNEYLSINLEHLGIIYKDLLQDTALNSRIPIIKYKPNSIISQAIYRIADKLTQFENITEAPLDIQAIVDESYQIAEMEADVDFQTKVHYIEELLHCGDLSKGDLVETVKSQQFEIEKLKRENLLLKKKLLKAIQEGFII